MYNLKLIGPEFNAQLQKAHLHLQENDVMILGRSYETEPDDS